jgi:hypothetical protein
MILSSKVENHASEHWNRSNAREKNVFMALHEIIIDPGAGWL